MPNAEKKVVHLIGIGGCGMAGLAELCHQAGYQVSGSDVSESEVTQRLSAQGIQVYIGHRSEQILNPNIVVVSSAIAMTNPELIAAQDQGITVLHRTEMLARLIEDRQTIIILGTHGKTTTTALLSSILLSAEVQPGFAVGATLAQTGTNAALGEGKLFVLEGDESDASFENFRAKIVVLLNIDHDHLGTYQQDIELLKSRYLSWINQLDEDALIFVNNSDPHIQKMMTKIERRTLSFSVDKTADLRVVSWEQKGLKTEFFVLSKNEYNNYQIKLPGKHNVENASAAIAVAQHLNLSPERIQKGLTNFAGVSRRCQVYNQAEIAGNKVVLVEDYGHHPLEVEVTLSAIKAAYPERRVLLVFQPHRYTRTQEHFDEFVRVLSKSDLLLLSDIYPASESPIEGVSSEALLAKIREKNPAAFIGGNLSQTQVQLETLVKVGDVVLIQGAGDVNRLCSTFVNSDHALSCSDVLSCETS